MSLEGKRALITGSSRGIGRATALKLAERGVQVAVRYYQNEEAANDTLANVLLCREEAGFITGQTLYVGGGASIMDSNWPLEIQGAT